MALPKQVIDLPFGKGIGTKNDARLLPPPKLARADNVRFTELGGLQKRNPFASFSNKIQGGGTLSNVRKLGVNDDELICFTETKLYSWAPGIARWVERSDHPAITVTEAPVLTRTEEQPLCDRAQAGGVIAYIWSESDQVLPYVAAKDANTGAFIYGPTLWTGDGTNVDRFRVVALGDRFLFVIVDSLANESYYTVVDPEAFSNDVSNTSVLSVISDNSFDVAVVDGDAFIAFVESSTTGYTLAKITKDGTLTSATHARVASGNIAIAGRGQAGSRKLCVMRTDSTAVDADLFDETTFDTSAVVGMATTDSSDQLTCAWREEPETNGTYRCYGFWSGAESEDATNDFETVTSYIDDAGNAGTKADLVKRQGVAAQAFGRGAHTYCWVAFAQNPSTGGLATPLGLRAQLQNSYFLVRDDGLIVARAVQDRAGGFIQKVGMLPSMQKLDDNMYAWSGIERRIIPVGERENSNQSDFAQRSPVDIIFTFDSNGARRTDRIGKTLYLSGSPVSGYDGEGLTELGFHLAPYYFASLELGTGQLPDAQTYNYRVTYSWENAKGELDRSTSAAAGQLTTSAANAEWQLTMVPLHVTNKGGANGRGEAAVEVWRTKTDPVSASPFYLTTSRDPSDTTGDNRYVENDATVSTLSAYVDNLLDANLEAEHEQLIESTGELATTPPPPASIIYAGDERLYLAGIANEPHVVAYSKLRRAGEVVAFNGTLRFEVPRDGGAIKALAEFYGNLVVLAESSVFTVPGDGFDNIGAGNNFGPAQVIATDTGALSPEGVVITPQGILFKSAKGWYIFDRGFTVRYVGQDVTAFDGEEVLSAVVLTEQHEVRIVTSERVLMYDYVADAWSHWTIDDAVDAVLWQGKYVYATDDSVLVESTHAETPANYSMVVETAWVNLAGLQGYGRCYSISPLGRRLSDHSLKLELAKNGEDEFFQTKYHAVPDRPVLAVKHGPAVQKVAAIKLRITDLDPDQSSLPVGESLQLSGISLEVGVRRGQFRHQRDQRQ